MHDTLFKAATVIDGTGLAPFTADVAIKDGRVVEVGRLQTTAKHVVNAEGAWLTPGFIDIHTHYDGQATWDDTLAPSLLHGTSAVVMGNCGVGFAPVRPGEQDRLIRLMEGVEEIPGAALSEGIQFRWESFAEYLDALAAKPRSIHTATLVPHDCLRYYVMGERAARLEAATPQDCADMQALLRDALRAGASGFSTGRSDNHRTSLGEDTPAATAAATELRTLAAGLQGLGHRVIHAVSDFDAQRGAASDEKLRFDAEYALLEAMAEASGRALALTWLDRLNAPQQRAWLQAAAEGSSQKGLKVRLQTASRAIGVLSGLETSFSVLTPYRRYHGIAHLPLAERAAALRDPIFKAALLADERMSFAKGNTAIPPIVDHIMATLDHTAMLMFAMRPDAQGLVSYEPSMNQSLGAQARASGRTALEVIYDYLAEGDGSNIIYFPIFNYMQGNLNQVREMLRHPQALWALGDAGAHVGTVCDASSTTSLLLQAVAGHFRLEDAVHWLTQRNAAHMGWTDRGRIASGALADLNLIDPSTLGVCMPHVVRDLPAGGKRVAQSARGYVQSWVSGQLVCADGALTAARPGGLIRGS